MTLTFFLTVDLCYDLCDFMCFVHPFALGKQMFENQKEF